MRRRSTLLAFSAAAAIIAAPLIPISAAAADPEIISSVDFEDGTTGDWFASGDPTLTVTADPNGGAGQVLSVADRTETWHTLQSPEGLFTEGVTYTLSARVLVQDAAAQARFLVKDGYHWVADKAIPAGEWTTISGTLTADADDTQVYIEVDPATSSFYLDDVLITRAPAPGGGDSDVAPGGAVDPTTTPVSLASGSGNVSALTFDDGPNGATTAALLDYLKTNDIHAVFCVIGQNITAPGGADLLRRTVAEGHTLCNHTTSYTDMGSWDADSIRTDLVENLRIIREALGDPDAQVPFFRAPNGSWGATAAVAVSLGMQPLAVTNTINDWAETDPAVLTENLRTAMKPGEIVLVHDGGGDREPSLQALATVVDERLADGWVFTLPLGTPAPQQTGALIDTSFDDGELDGWFARSGSGESAPTISVVPGGADDSAFAAQVSDRTHEGDGIQFDVVDVLLPGSTYLIEAAVRFAEGADVGQGLSISMRTVTGESASYANLLQIEDASVEGWTTVSGEFTVPAYDTAAELYVEARYNSGNTSAFLVDQFRVSVPEPNPVDTSLVPIKDTVDFPVGVAIDSRETSGAAADLLLHHFDQITPENHMKVEAWYDENGDFQRNAEATALLDFSQQNDLRMYGHVLLWHSQTPDWFFQDDSGRELTDTDADKQILRDRLAIHIDNVARSISDDYGLYGSSTNPIVAWDVVNEVVADQSTDDGLRTSRWYQVLGEEYIPLAFELAEEAFNNTYAASGTDRPVMLFINDYNTEQDRKGAQYEALVKRLLAAGVPLDGVGHQFHVSINTTIASLQGALDRFAGLGLLQEVTELDVTINPVTEANRIRQGYFYRDVFRLLRSYDAAAPDAEKVFAATIWGLTDNRSWRSEQEPLVFSAGLQAKPAYYGVIDDPDGLPALITTANVFAGDIALADGFAGAIEWQNLPENVLTGDVGGFQARWSDDHLTVLVRSTVAPDRVEFTYGDQEFVYQKDAPDSVPGIETVVGGEHLIAVHLPHSEVVEGSSAKFDVRVIVNDSVAGAWNSPGETGRLTFLEPLSYLEIPELPAPTVDGIVDEVWADAAVAQTARTVEGDASGAQAQVRTLWQGNQLYVLYEVTDPVVDNSNSDAWNRDSVEVFLDLGNTKAGTYGPNDTQIRITTDGDLSFGTGDAALQQARVASSATALTETGYVVEVAIDLLGESGGQSDVPLGGLDTFHGLDFQVNDGRDGARFAVHTWAEPTGTGYQNTARWGVARLVSAEEPSEPTEPTEPTEPAEPGTPTEPTEPGTPTEPTEPGDPGDGEVVAWATVDVGDGRVEQGGALPVTVSGLEPGQQITATLFSDPIEIAGISAADASGRVTFEVSIPADLPLGAHTLVIASGELDPISAEVTVVAPGQLAVTGAQLPWGIALAVVVLLVIGGMLVAMRPARLGRR
ncbi:endo-1,4-beta-xylanase [Microbacterium sp. A84]|uniref:endo-1,4-beta-xylanase n=1 Tax=Microbacterium sp. A84 TaxID=3450715 RepID=UPI003F42A434